MDVAPTPRPSSHLAGVPRSFRGCESPNPEARVGGLATVPERIGARREQLERRARFRIPSGGIARGLERLARAAESQERFRPPGRDPLALVSQADRGVEFVERV